MILIADAGSTKTEWRAVADNGSAFSFETRGINALMLGREELKHAFDDALGSLPCPPDEIYFYGAGCVGSEVCGKVRDALPANAYVEVESDMLGAARALLGRKPGLAAIMGTGSNSALYDGRRLVDNMPPLGYILGDEGSGASFGKRLLHTVYRTGKLRPELERHLGMTYGEILERVYRRPAANTFLASLMPFILDHSNELGNMIEAELDSFFAALAAYYKLERHVSLTGGVAVALGAALNRAAALRGFTIDRIQERPMEGLIAYHTHEHKTH